MVGEVADSSGGSCEVFEEAVDGFGGAVAGAGVVEERKDVCAAPFHGPPERADLLKPGRDPGLEAGDQPGHDLVSLGRIRGLVGVDHVLVDAPGHLESSMAFVGEHLGEPVLLSLGQERGPGSGDVSDTVERITRAALKPQGLLLDALAAVPCRGHRRGRGLSP